MKFSHFLKVVALAAASLLATAAFAAGAHKGSLQINDPVQVNGKQLKSGDYTVTWDGEGPSVNLHFLKGGREVASAPATVKSLDQKASEDALEVTGTDKDRQITAIRFSGKKFQIDLGTENSQASGKSGDSMK